MIKDRIKKIIQAEQFTPTKFADAVGVQRSNISHILSGRNKPSLDFIQKVLTTFGNLNSDWLLFGRGSMYNDETTKDLMASPGTASAGSGKQTQSSQEKDNTDGVASQTSQSQMTTPEDEPPQAAQSASVFGKIAENQTVGQSKQIVRIIVIFQDGTFKEYTPG